MVTNHHRLPISEPDGEHLLLHQEQVGCWPCTHVTVSFPVDLDNDPPDRSCPLLTCTWWSRNYLGNCASLPHSAPLSPVHNARICGVVHRLHGAPTVWSASNKCLRPRRLDV